MNNLVCPDCNGMEFIKYGKHDRTGKQRYKCKNKSCGSIITEQSQKKLEEKHLIALLLTMQGYTARSIARLLNVSPSTITNWVELFSESWDIESKKTPINEFNCKNNEIKEKTLSIQIKSRPSDKNIEITCTASTMPSPDEKKK